MKEATVEFCKEGKYSLDPAQGPIIEVKVGDIVILGLDKARQIQDDKWGVILEDEEVEEVDEVLWPETVLVSLEAGDIDEAAAKEMLVGDAILKELEVEIDKRKSVKNIVADILEAMSQE